MVGVEGLEPPVIPAPKAGGLAAGLHPDGVSLSYHSENRLAIAFSLGNCMDFPLGVT